MGSDRSSGSNMTDLEQTLNEPLIFLQGKQKTLASHFNIKTAIKNTTNIT